MNLIKFSTTPSVPWFGGIDRWLDEAFRSGRDPVEGSATSRFVPRIDIVEDDKKIVVRADLPGVNEKDVETRLDDGLLTLRGERKLAKESKDENLRRAERGYDSFVRSFTLPDTVAAEKIGAKYDKAVREITIPKLEAEQKKARVIDIH